MRLLKNTTKQRADKKIKTPAIRRSDMPAVTVVPQSTERLNLKITVTVLSLAIFGLVMICSASKYGAMKNCGDAFYYVKKQAVALFIGAAAMFGTSMVTPQVIKKFRYVILAVSFALLGVIFIPSVGVESYGARRWIDLGFITLQPSEIAKFGFVIFAAAYISDYGVDKLKRLLPVLCVGVAMCVLIMMQPNMSITMCLGAVMLLMLFVGGVNPKHFALLMVPVIVAVPLLIIAEPYRMKRIMAFLDPWASPKAEGYQLIQSYYALGRGGLFGVGLGNSRQKYLFLPFAESDFIFSVVGEELGIVGAACVMIVFCMLVYYGLLTAAKAKTRYEALLAFGVIAIIGVQTLLNLAVVTGCIPPTGLPLPFVSAGGSSLVSFMAATGMLLSINKQSGTFNFPDHNM